EQGQSPWIDFIDRQLIESGRLDELIGQGLRGLTSNPTIFAKAVSGGHYDDLVRRMIDDGESDQAIYEEIAVGDVGEALDHLRPIYDESDGGDGYASIEGLRGRLANGQDVHRVAAVASFFVSRVDTKVDKRLEEMGTDSARNCLGTAAIANAGLAYKAYHEIFHGPEFAELREAGAQV